MKQSTTSYALSMHYQYANEIEYTSHKLQRTCISYNNAQNKATRLLINDLIYWKA